MYGKEKTWCQRWDIVGWSVYLALGMTSIEVRVEFCVIHELCSVSLDSVERCKVRKNDMGGAFVGIRLNDPTVSAL